MLNNRFFAPVGALIVAMVLAAACQQEDRSPTAVSSQVNRASPLCVSGCDSVLVTPKGDRVTVPANTSGWQQTFIVKNVGMITSTFTFTCTTTGTATCTGIDLSGATLSPGQTAEVTATYSVGAPGLGSLSLTATDGSATDRGYIKISAS